VGVAAVEAMQIPSPFQENADMSEPKSQKVTVEAVKPTEPTAPSGRALSYFEETEQEFERMLDSFLSRFRPLRRDWPTMRLPFEGRSPKVDVIDRDDDILIKAELPGVDKKDLDVSVTDNSVTIKASTRRESKEEKGDYYRQEISSGYIARTVALPSAVDAKRATAELKDGVLQLTLAKIEKSKRQRIEVK
jgi:HSP20 family protein